ncbi:MAG TPA: peptidylprolyl isomerase [Planctomycetota bacterium]|nr:peptidylprolyl isomerase [Planctomycetota bacterium]
MSLNLHSRESFMKPILVSLVLLLPLAVQLQSQSPAAVAPTGAPLQMDPLTFDPPLPTDPIARVHGRDVPASEMLQLVLEQNFQNSVSTLILGLMLECELARQEKVVTDEGIRDELKVMLEQSAPGATVESLEATSPDTLKQMTRTARIHRGWKELYWDARAIPQDQRHSQTTQMMMQLYMQEITERYERRIRGNTPPPSPGYVAEVIEKATGKEMRVTASEALDFLMALVKESGLLDAAKEAAERAVLNYAMQDARVTVTDQEVAEWAQLQRTTYPPPLGWDMICRYKGTSPEREMDRWRRIQAYKRITNKPTDDKEVEKYLEENKSFFLGKTKRFSHILLRDTDATTGMPKPQEEAAEVKANIEAMHRKIVEGASFEWLAENYSEDPVTARGQGRLGQPLKQFGGGMDPAFLKAAWQLEKIGDISPPVKSAFGWHIIKLDEINNPGAKEPDFRSPTYWAYITDEYETRLMESWFQALKEKANIELKPVSEILSYKRRSYVK